MSGWRPASSVTPGGWATVPSDAWREWKPERPKGPGHNIIITKQNDYALL